MKNQIITSDDILGKLAIDSEGGVLGTVVKLHIDKKLKQVVGITVDQGFLKPDLFIGIDYIRTFGVDAVLLNEVPLDTLKGRRVLSAAGNIVGTVKKIVRKGNTIVSVQVAKGRKTVEVKAKLIREAGESIILRKNWDKDAKNE